MNIERKLVLIVVLGVTARILLWNIVPVTGDAVYHYSVARYVAANWRIPSFEYVSGGDPFWYPPLFHVLGSFFYLLLGSEKITPLFVGILSLFAYYMLLKRFYNSLLLPGMFFAAFLPVQMYYSAIGYVDSLFFLLAPLILYSYLSYLEKNDMQFLGVSLLLSAASFLTHYHGFIPLLAISIHLLFRNKKLAVGFLITGLLLSSPWYVRNYIVFGNPVWPLLFDGKYPASSGYKLPMVVNVLNPEKWIALFFEYWTGAPNSGEDYARNFEIAGNYIPYSGLFSILWLALACALSLGILYGLAKMLEDKNKSLFLLFIALSIIPLLLSNFVRMLAFVFPIVILALSNAFSRVLKPEAADKCANKFNAILLVIIFAGLVSAPFAYGFVYSKIVGKYTPFYRMANEMLPKDAVVCNMFDDQFFNNVDRKMAPAGMIPEERVTFPCATDPSNQSVCFKKHKASYVCCTSLRTIVLGGELQKFCEKTMMEKKPDIEYNGGEGIWGRCWAI